MHLAFYFTLHLALHLAIVIEIRSVTYDSKLFFLEFNFLALIFRKALETCVKAHNQQQQQGLSTRSMSPQLLPSTTNVQQVLSTPTVAHQQMLSTQNLSLQKDTSTPTSSQQNQLDVPQQQTQSTPTVAHQQILSTQNLLVQQDTSKSTVSIEQNPTISQPLVGSDDPPKAYGHPAMSPGIFNFEISEVQNSPSDYLNLGGN